MSRCVYCGTELVDEPAHLRGREMVDERAHTASVCLDYVYNALQATKRDVPDVWGRRVLAAALALRADYQRNPGRSPSLEDALVKAAWGACTCPSSAIGDRWRDHDRGCPWVTFHGVDRVST